jgi:Protein of unknown function (DUF2628)
MNTSILNAYLGDKADYYLRSFEKVSTKGTAWNWAAFLLGIGWLCYRGMYRYALIFGILVIVETVVEIMFSLPESISNGVTIGIWVGFGMLGNTIFKMHCDKQMALIESMPLSDDERLAVAAAKGKPSMANGFLGMFLFIVAIIALIYLIEVILG